MQATCNMWSLGNGPSGNDFPAFAIDSLTTQLVSTAATASFALWKRPYWDSSPLCSPHFFPPRLPCTSHIVLHVQSCNDAWDCIPLERQVLSCISGRYYFLTERWKYCHIHLRWNCPCSSSTFPFSLERDVFGYHSLSEYVVKSPDKFSIFLDESTSTSSINCLIVYIRIPFQNQARNFLYKLTELKAGTGEAICNTQLQCLHEQGNYSAGLAAQIHYGWSFCHDAKIQGVSHSDARENQLWPGDNSLHEPQAGTCRLRHSQENHSSKSFSFFSPSPKHMWELEAMATEFGVRARS